MKKNNNKSSSNSSEFLIKFMGNPVTKIPHDLYIPPYALQIFLEMFEGPLDLLLYLIKRNNMDILNLEVSTICEQYIQYVEMMKKSQFELAAEYLVMAATLIEIKSRLLLPIQASEDEEELDPRVQLMNRLQQYECFKKAADDLDKLPRLHRETYTANVYFSEEKNFKVLPDIDIIDITIVMAELLNNVPLYQKHEIQQESISTRECMTIIMTQISYDEYTDFLKLTSITNTKLSIVVTFISILELIKESLIEYIQNKYCSTIYIKFKTE